MEITPRGLPCAHPITVFVVAKGRLAQRNAWMQQFAQVELEATIAAAGQRADPVEGRKPLEHPSG